MNSSKKTNIHQKGLSINPIGYMPGLDGLRAFAVFAVIAYHLGVTWAPGGLLGVNLFFVLSGYLITNILQAQLIHSGKLDLKHFWLRRAKRLLPALYVMLTGVLIWAVLFAPERIVTLKSEILAAIFYFSNWYLIFHDVSYFESFGPPSPLGHLWSLAIEEQFYILWPFLLGLGFRLFRHKWVIRGTIFIALISALTMAVIYIPGIDPSRVYYGTDTRAFALLLGAVLAMVWPRGRMSPDLSVTRKLALDTAGSIGLLIVLWMILKTNQYQTFLYQSGLLIFSIAATVLVAVLAHPASRLAGLFSWRPLRLLGKWSYGIYLWHYPVIILTNPLVNTGELDVLRSLWQIAISVFLAILSYYLIEEPIRYGKIKPLHLTARVSVSMLLIFTIMFATANGSQQISAAEQMTGGDASVVEEEAEMTEEQSPQVEEEAADEEDLASDENPGEEVIENNIVGKNVTIIGDSIMINVIPFLQESFPDIIVDAKKGRQMNDAKEVISELKKQGKIGETIIIGLGTNGAFTEKQLRDTLDCLEEAKEILLLNSRVPRPWESVVNETMVKVVESYPNARLIDWYSMSSGHDEYFYQDGVHLNLTGAEAYCKMIVDALSPET